MADTIDTSQAKHFLDSSKLPQISSEQLLTLNAPISQTEIEEAIKTLASNKSPGPDDLSDEFYKLTWEFIPQTLNKVFNGIWEGGVYLPLGHQAYIKLIAKKGKDPTEPGCYLTT